MRGLRRASLLLSGLLMVTPSAARQDAFTELALSAGGTHTVSAPRLETFWDPGTGIELGVATPFYGGYVVLGTRVLPYSPVADVPSFRALLAFAGWERPLVSAGPVSVSAQGRLGNLRMTFDDASERQAGIRNESELTAGVALLARVAVGKSGSVNLIASGERTFTRRILDQSFASIQYEHRLAMPDWLRDFLR